MKGTLYILVENFSNSSRETFFERELPYLSVQFKKIKVIALYPDETVLNFKADNVEVLDYNYFQACNRPKVFLKNFLSITYVLFFEIIKTHNKKFYFKNFRHMVNGLTLSFSAASNLENFIKQDLDEHTIFYSYWFRQWVAALSIVKMRHPELKLLSRVHGGDYDEDQIKSVFAFRYFQLSKVSHIFPVSDYGKNYLQRKFCVKENKITTARLGLLLESSAPVIDSSVLHLVSCSSLIPLKRVHLIVEILKHLKTPYRWTHFGSGPLLDVVKEKAKPLLHQVEFKGHVSNADFIKYLKTNAVSFFINVSESEGIPVSMMEAISQGIPLVGTNICGVPEIVTGKTGLLLDVNFDVSETAGLIALRHQSGWFYDPDLRKGIREFYKEKFYAPANYSKLALQLKDYAKN